MIRVTRFLGVLCLGITLLGVLTVPTLAKPGGNSTASAACAGEGYRNYTDLNGNGFKNEGQCTRYEAQGNALVTPTAIPTAVPTAIPTAVPEDPLVTRCRQDATAAGFDGSAFTQVLVGTEGDDDFRYERITSTTLVCGFGGGDLFYITNGNALVLGGDGNDYLDTLYSGTFNGDAGDDRVFQCEPGTTFNGGAGTNTLKIDNGCNLTQVVVDPYARTSGSRVAAETARQA